MLVVASLGGCAFRNWSLPKGVYLPACAYGVDPQAQPARCRTRTEYLAAKEKARIEEARSDAGDSQTADPRYKDWIP